MRSNGGRTADTGTRRRRRGKAPRLSHVDGAGNVSFSSSVTDTTMALESLPRNPVASWKVVAEFLNGIPLESPVRPVRPLQAKRRRGKTTCRYPSQSMGGER